MQKPTLIPAIIYEDAPAAIDFLVNAFGFERIMVVPGPNNTIVHSELLVPGTSAMVMVGSSATSWLGLKSPRALGGLSSGVYIVVDKVDAHCERARSAGAKIMREPTDQEYGGRDYSCLDPEGHLWSFGTYQPALEPST
jgi:uncharacterized glyoxalase superfamily protein PhnB